MKSKEEEYMGENRETMKLMCIKEEIKGEVVAVMRLKKGGAWGCREVYRCTYRLDDFVYDLISYIE